MVGAFGIQSRLALTMFSQALESSVWEISESTEWVSPLESFLYTLLEQGTRVC